MGTLFKSEAMSRCQVEEQPCDIEKVIHSYLPTTQVYLPPEAAYNCVAELGELGDASMRPLFAHTCFMIR